MSHWTKGKFRQREPPPAVFVQGSPTTSKVSLSGNVGAVGGPGSGSGSGGGAGVSVGAVMSSGGSGGVLSPVMPTLQRTTSRLRQEVAGSTVPPTTTSSGGIVSEGGGGAGSSGGAGGPGSPPMTAAAAASAASANNTYSLPLPLPLPLRRPSSSRATDRADSLWAEMQATLEEVELSASEGTRVFGPDHDGKLAELRQAQIALAQAWARSEADDAIETTLSSAAAAATAAETARTGTTSGGTGTGTGMGTGAGTAPGTATGAATGTAPGTAEGEQLHATISNLAKTTTTGTTPSGARDDVSGTAGADGSTAGTATASAAAPPGSSVSAAAVARMEAEETQVDILLARKRREANDRYFQRVGRGVLDVVAKLDDVAVAMRAVEQESKDMFGDNGVEEEDEGEA